VTSKALLARGVTYAILLSVLVGPAAAQDSATESDAITSDPVEQDILEHIGWRDHDSWNKVAEQLAAAEHGEENLSGCDYCGSFAIPNGGPCQACFQEIKEG